jgi:isoleucyl-tRNA synthetase
MLSQVNLVEDAAAVSKSCEQKYISVTGTSSGAVVGVTKASGQKCGRCWFYDSKIGTLGLPHADVCQRCHEAIFSWEKKTGETLNTSKAKEAKEPVA